MMRDTTVWQNIISRIENQFFRIENQFSRIESVEFSREFGLECVTQVD